MGGCLQLGINKFGTAGVAQCIETRLWPGGTWVQLPVPELSFMPKKKFVFQKSVISRIRDNVSDFPKSPKGACFSGLLIVEGLGLPKLSDHLPNN